MYVLSRDWLFATPWTVQPARLLCPRESPGKNTRLGCHFLFQEIFLTQGWNLASCTAGDSLPSEPPGQSLSPLSLATTTLLSLSLSLSRNLALLSTSCKQEDAVEGLFWLAYSSQHHVLWFHSGGSRCLLGISYFSGHRKMAFRMEMYNQVLLTQQGHKNGGAKHTLGFLVTSGKKHICRCGCGFDPRVGKIPWRRKWQPNPVFLPGRSHGQRSLAGNSPWVHRSWTRLSD